MKRLKSNPFRTPDHYFDSIEDRIIVHIETLTKKKSSSGRVIQFLKPVLGIAASLSIVYLLVYSPFRPLDKKGIVKSEIATTTSSDLIDDSTLNLFSVDENTLVDAIFSDENSDVPEINPDEMFAYLSSGLNEVQIYSEIPN